MRNRETGRYFAGPNGWVGNGDGAHDFGTVENGVELARAQNLAVTEVVLRDDNPGCDLVLHTTGRIR